MGYVLHSRSGRENTLEGGYFTNMTSQLQYTMLIRSHRRKRQVMLVIPRSPTLFNHAMLG